MPLKILVLQKDAPDALQVARMLHVFEFRPSEQRRIVWNMDLKDDAFTVMDDSVEIV